MSTRHGLRHVTEISERDQAVTAGIRASWNTLAELNDAGRITDEQLEYVVGCEPPDGAPLLLRTIWLARLRQWLMAPESIGPEKDPTTACLTCHSDDGWESTSKGARPCAACNPDQFALWRDHWRIKGHSCPDCAPKPVEQRRSRPRGPREPLYERDDPRDAEDQAVQDELI